MTLLSSRRTLPICCSPLGLAAISASLLIMAAMNQSNPVTNDPWVWKAGRSAKDVQLHGRNGNGNKRPGSNLPKAVNITPTGDEESSNVKRQAFEPVTTIQAKKADQAKLEVLHQRAQNLVALGRPVYPDSEENSASTDEEVLKNRQKVMEHVHKLIHSAEDQMEQDSRYSPYHAPSGKIINTRPLKNEGFRLPLQPPAPSYGLPTGGANVSPRPQLTFNGPVNSSPRPNFAIGDHVQSILQSLHHQQGSSNQPDYSVPVYIPGSRPSPASTSSVNVNFGYPQQQNHQSSHVHSQHVNHEAPAAGGQTQVQSPLAFLQGYHGNGQQQAEPLMFLAEIQQNDQHQPVLHFGNRPINSGECHCQKKLANGILPSVDEAGFRPYYGELQNQQQYGGASAQLRPHFGRHSQRHNGKQHGQKKGVTIPLLIKIFPHVIPVETNDHGGEQVEVHHHHPANFHVEPAVDHNHGHGDHYVGSRVGRGAKTGSKSSDAGEGNGENRYVSPTSAGNELASRIIQQRELQQLQRSGSDITEGDGSLLKTTIDSNSPVDT